MKQPVTKPRFPPRTTVAVSLLIAVITASLFISGCIGDTDDGAETVKMQIAGSTTVLPIAEECARIFMEKHPGSRIDVAGGGSSHGIKSVAYGTVDIGSVSRDMKPSEKEKYPDLVLHAIAKDGIAVVVHPSNPVSDLTMAQLRGIYTGEIANWNEVGGTDYEITVVSREEGSGTRDCFEQAVMKPIEKEIADRAIIQDSNGKIRTTVAGNKQAIGFISLGYINSDVKAVKLDGVEPTVGSVRSGEYAISRTLRMITKGEPDSDEQAFLGFVLGAEGQKIVEDVHFISVE